MSRHTGDAIDTPQDKCPTLSIVIVNWNSGSGLDTCLRSIERAKHERFALESVVVVDNASTDASLSGIDQTSLPIVEVRNDRNVGFAAACNQGAAQSDSDLILLLNPDTRLSEDSLDVPVTFLCQHENRRVGICGIQLRDEHDHVSRTCGVFPTLGNLLSITVGLNSVLPSVFPGLEMKRWDHLNSRRVDHVIGAFYLVRRSVFEALNGLDTRFFVYFEDLDFSLRAAHAGWESYYLTTASAYHEAGGSSKRIKATRLFYVCRSRVQLAWKHLSPAHAAAITAAVLVVEPCARLVQTIFAGELHGIRDVLAGTARIWKTFAGSPRTFMGLDIGGSIGDKP